MHVLEKDDKPSISEVQDTTAAQSNLNSMHLLHVEYEGSNLQSEEKAPKHLRHRNTREYCTRILDERMLLLIAC